MVLNGYTKTNCCQEVTWRPHHHPALFGRVDILASIQSTHAFWELLENPISFDKLVASLIGEHDVPVEICRQ